MKVLTIGTATRDVFIGSNFFKVVRDPQHLRRLGFPTGEAECLALGGKIEIDEPVFTVGGGAANSAVTFARMGFETRALIRIGRDISGESVLETLRDEGIKTMPVFDKKTGTAYSVILVFPSGERTILHFRGASEGLSVGEISGGKLGVNCAYIAPGRISFKTVEYLVRRLKKEGVLVAMNPSKYYILKRRDLRRIFDCLDVVVLNREEGAYLTGKKYEDERGIFGEFDRWVGGLAVMTDGPKGVIVSDGRNIYRAGIFKDQGVVDRTGAGDAFGSGFVAGLVMGSGIRHQKSWSSDRIQNAIKLGSANATSVVEAIGAQAGILTRARFSKERRWRGLRVEVSNI